MPIVTDGPMLAPERGIHELAGGFGASIGATAAEAWSDSPLSQLGTIGEIERAKGAEGYTPTTFDPLGGAVAPSVDGVDITEAVKPAVPRMDIIEANDRVKKAGLDKHLTLPDQPDIPPAQLEVMMRNAQARAEREATIARGPQGFIPSALQVGTSFLVGAADPINIASAFIPVMGELRYGKLLAAAGDSLSSRLALRAGVGAAQGAVGQAALEPLDWWSHTQEGRDFGMSDVLHNIMFGAALGGGLHAAGGFAADVYRGSKGRALYPFGPGEPLENVAGTHVPATVLHEDGITPEALEAHFKGDPVPEAAPSPEIAAIADLPPRAHEDAMRVAIADLINGDAVRAGDVLEAAVRTDPRIAESFEAWHGSPHEFDRFDISKIGTGEGNQAYGRGLYFAENERVARDYQRSLAQRDGLISDIVQREGGNWEKARAAFEKDIAARQRMAEQVGGKYEPTEMERAILARLKTGEFGNIYKVAIKANRDHFIDLDKPLSEQSEFVRKALLEHPDPGVAGTAEKWGHDVHNMMRRIGYRAGPKEIDDTLGREAATSRVLAEAGIPGVKYLDQGSRDRGDGSRNFVVFNDKDIEITHKNGEPVKREEFLQQRAALAGERASGENPAAAPPRDVPAANLDRAAAWRGIAHVTPDFDAPDIVAASNAAAKAEPPKTKLDERVAASEKAEAYAKAMYDMFAHRLPEQDRLRLQETIAEFDRSKADFDTVTQRGAACLFEGRSV